MKVAVDDRGYYGKFGGAYIPEMLYPNVEELRLNYREIMEDPGFQKDFKKLLKDYVGRPTPLYLAERLSEKYGAKVYLKREDSAIPGRIRSTTPLGRFCLPGGWAKRRLWPKPVPGSTAWPPPRFARSWTWNVSCTWANWTCSANGQMWNACGYSARKCARQLVAAKH